MLPCTRRRVGDPTGEESDGYCVLDVRNLQSHRQRLRLVFFLRPTTNENMAFDTVPSVRALHVLLHATRRHNLGFAAQQRVAFNCVRYLGRFAHSRDMLTRSLDACLFSILSKVPFHSNLVEIYELWQCGGQHLA